MRKQTRQLSLKECYDILRLDKGADLEAVKKAYRQRAFELHPDLNPGSSDASRQFQILNEAYVALSGLLKAQAETKSAERENESAQSQDVGRGREDDAKSAASGAKASEDFSSASAKEAGSYARAKAEKSSGEAQSPGASRQAKNASRAYAEHDVLRDLLNDPFARRVFEDIYSELNRKQSQENSFQAQETWQATNADEAPKSRKKTSQEKKGNTSLHQGNIAWGTPKWTNDLSKGVTGVVKDWLRRQIDEEQSLTLPGRNLLPGRRIRLQIRQGLSDEVQAIEVTLPPDFVVGKPFRLRGLGKRIGPWQGDLYLTIHAQ